MLKALAGVGIRQGGAGPAVQFPAACFQHAVVGDLAGQRMREQEDSLRAAVPLPEELQPFQLLQPRLQRHIAVPDLLGQVE